jgi:membrane protein DedA with SNARE-associated domain
MDLITTLTADLTAWVVDAAGAPWVYLLVFICCTVDGFFPPFPSESVVVGLASLIVTQGTPNPWLLMLAAALGAFIGDNTAYAIGRGIGLTRFRWMRRPRAQRSFAWASSELDKRAASLLLVGRFLPIGRVAVNLAAGTTGYPRRRFVALSALAGSTWGAYSVGIGALAGAWFTGNQLLGVAVAIGVAVLIGFAVDRILTAAQGTARTGVLPAPAGGPDLPDLGQAA